MIIFIYGEDTFRSRQKLKELKNKFTKELDPGENNLTILDGKNITIKEIGDGFGARSLLSKKRMVIIENIFSTKNKKIFEEINDYLKKIKIGESDNIIIFWEDGIKTKSAGSKKIALSIDSSGKETPLPKNKQLLFNFLIKQPYTQEFKTLSSAEASAWIKKKFDKYGVTINNQAIQTLISLIGSDLWKIDNEIAKLANYKTDKIEIEDIEKFVKGSVDENIFALTDAISSRNKKLASKLLKEQYEAGLTDSHLISMIIRQFKILLQIRQALDSRFTSQKIINSLKLHPFVAQKGINQVRNFNSASLKNIFNQLVEIDYLTKTGKGEAKILLNLFIQKI
ncbi:MAG: DNA polymerase III subunit delta [Patescibacteria group bacterium]